MRKKFQRIGSLALAAVLSLSLCVPALAADRATAVRDGAFLKGTFTYGPHESTKDLTDSYIYSDDYFKASSYAANEHLATMSMQMAAASISSEDAGYAEKSQNVQALLTALGFQKVEVNDCYKQEMQQNTMGAAAAYKMLDDKTVLLAIVPRSAGYEKEWGGNFNVGSGSGDESGSYTTNAAGFQGTDGLHAGFQLARNIVLDFAANYVRKNADVFTGKTVKVWTVGYSRGAATANLVGAALADGSYDLGVTVQPENVYAYTFGTPATVIPQSGVDVRGDAYRGIHNYFADYDPVTMVPFSAWGFTRYGQDVTYNASTRKSRMLRFLQAVNPNVYNIYTAAAGTGDPDNFKGYTLGEGLTLTPSGETASQKAFLQERIKHLTETIADTRADYANHYQTALSTLAGFYLGDSRADRFAQGISASENRTELTQLVLLLALYDWAEEYQESSAADKNSTAAEALNDVLPPVGDTGYLASDEYKDLRDKVTSDTSLDDYLTATNAEKSEYIQQTETLMKEILTAGFDAAGVAADDFVRTTALSDVAVSGLTKFIGYFIFGTDATLSELKSSENVSEAVKDALLQKINTAATLVGNAGTYMRVHNNEVILSWLRTMDSYYDDPVVDDTDDSEPTYAVRTSVIEHGTVNISARSAESGDRVTLTVTPDDGYELDSLTVTDGKGNTVALTDNGNGKYVFTMPGSRVTISAVFREKWVGPAYERFSDLKADAWYRDGVEYVLKKDIMRGVSDSLFAPNETTSRAMVITVLWRAAGSPVVNYAVSFSDVTAGSWYAEAVAWAASEGIVTGYADGRFGVRDIVTREQLAAILYRYAQKNGVDISVGENTNILSYNDAASIAEYAVPAMQWACGSGVVNGSTAPSGGMRLNPQGSATRAQFAAMLLRFSGAGV